MRSFCFSVLLFLCFVQYIQAQNETSVLLNGCDNCLQVNGSSNFLQEINEMTIEGWVNPNCSTGNNMIITKQWCSGEFSFSLSINEGKLSWVASPSGFCTSPNIYNSNNAVFPVGVFTHFAIVYSAANGVIMYIDGNIVPATWVQGQHTSIAPSSEPIRMGCYKNISGTKGNYFSGLLNNMRIWERALNSNEVNVSMNSMLTGSESGLLINFPMNQNNTFGSGFTTSNVVEGLENVTATPWEASTNLPAIRSYFEYQSTSIGFPDDTSGCNLNTITLVVPFEHTKQITWQDGSNQREYAITTSGEYSVAVETELCRILRDTFAVAYLEPSEDILNVSLCQGDSIVVNELVYKEGGVYTQNLTNHVGCDSILTITINQVFPTEGSESYTLCNGESIVINDVIYSEGGQFQQTLINSSGCDSLLTILITKGESSGSKHVFSLCNTPEFFFNGTLYNSAGQFEQVITNQSGCDSTITIIVLPCTQNVSYDFQQCNALTPENSMTYAEFVPTYRAALSCGSVAMSNVYREQPQMNKHSCTNGQGSTLAMCVGSSSSCQFEQADQTPVSFGFKANPVSGSYILFNHLEFYHLSPLQYSWIQGANGPNNYPKNFAIQIYKNDVLIYSETQLSTNQQWKKEKFDFFEDDSFKLVAGDSIRVELTPYCLTPNNGTESVWDIDNISLFFSCQDIENRIAGGIISGNQNTSITKTLERRNGNRILSIQSAGEIFEFPINNPFEQYTFSGFSDDTPFEGVSTYDLVLIQKYILGLTTFDNPLQFIAADINHDGKVSSTDLVELRKIILGVKETFPNNHSWRLVPKQNLNLSSDPLLWPDFITVEPGYHPVMNLDFIQVKIGDVDGVE